MMKHNKRHNVQSKFMCVIAYNMKMIIETYLYVQVNNYHWITEPSRLIHARIHRAIAVDI